jgi:hypothetical protein
MSSDSGESHASAPNGDEAAGSIAQDSLPQARQTEGASYLRENEISDVEQEELDSVVSGGNGLTFKTQTKPHDVQANASNPVPSSGRRPESPESLSTPDDTPSIQVCSDRTRKSSLSNCSRAPASHPPEVVFLPRTAHCALTGRPLFSLLKDASLLASRRLRWARPELHPHSSSLPGLVNRPSRAIAYFRCNKTRRTLHRRHGMS